MKAYAASRSTMDRTRTPLLRDLAFNRHSLNDGQHVSPYDNGRVEVGDDGIKVNLIQGLHPDFKEVLHKAVRATIGIDLDVPSGADDDWIEMLEGGLQTALESQVLVFEVSGVSRACTHQLVRSRRAAFHQQSMRASYYGDQPEFRVPESIWNAGAEIRNLWFGALEMAHEAYRRACEVDVSYQDARYILPEGTTNYIMLEYPLREFLNVYAYRGCSMFQWEYVVLMRMCRELVIAAYPFLEPYVKITCEQTHSAIDRSYDKDDPSTHHACRFQGWERVEGQCSFPWARDTNRTFRSKKHEIG